MLDDLAIVCRVRVCVPDDVGAARQWLQRELTGHTIIEAYQRYFRQVGLENETQDVLATWQAGNWAGAVEKLPDHLANQLGVFGSGAQCRVRLGPFVEAGVKRSIVCPFSPEADYQSSIKRTLTELGPRQDGYSPTKAS